MTMSNLHSLIQINMEESTLEILGVQRIFCCAQERMIGLLCAILGVRKEDVIGKIRCGGKIRGGE